jgi:hypothetical protein
MKGASGIKLENAWLGEDEKVLNVWREVVVEVQVGLARIEILAL